MDAMRQSAQVLIIALFSFLVWPASAHDSWISRGGYRSPAGEWCCGAQDCDALDGRGVGVTSQGYALRFLRDPDGRNEVVPYSEAQPSPDGLYWRCKRPDGSRRCFFAPPSSM